ncbi:MAG: hypothetical protein KY410_10605, partial [Proteobacteria bacterium]|nr:hypothetical protein [Pseudomonadota bacterium]
MKERNKVALTKEEIRRQRAIAIAEKIYVQQSKLFFRHNLLIPELEKMLRWCGVGVALKDPEFQAKTREDEYQ